MSNPSTGGSESAFWPLFGAVASVAAPASDDRSRLVRIRKARTDLTGDRRSDAVSGGVIGVMTDGVIGVVADGIIGVVTDGVIGAVAAVAWRSVVAAVTAVAGDAITMAGYAIAVTAAGATMAAGTRAARSGRAA